MLKTLPRIAIYISKSKQQLFTSCVRACHTASRLNAQRPFNYDMASESAAPVSITTERAEGQQIDHKGKIFKSVKEGKAYILVSPNARTSMDPQAKSKAGEHVYYSQNLLKGIHS